MPVARTVALSIDLQRAMAVLSDAERAAIVQCYHNDLSHEEAASVLGCPVGTVKTHILRAKQKLKARLGAWAPEG
jgi:RNA polymerase sigma-70 factor (ECF subfamily)